MPKKSKSNKAITIGMVRKLAKQRGLEFSAPVFTTAGYGKRIGWHCWAFEPYSEDGASGPDRITISFYPTKKLALEAMYKSLEVLPILHKEYSE